MALTDTVVPIPRRAENNSIQAGGWLAGLGAVAGFAALAASSCCVLPLALAGLGAGSAVFGGLEILTNWRPLLLGGSAVAVLAAWILLFWRRSVACKVDGPCSGYSASKSKWLLPGLGTVLVALSVAWDPFIESLLLKLAR